MTSPQSLQANLRRIDMSENLARQAAWMVRSHRAHKTWTFSVSVAAPDMADWEQARREAQEWLERHVVGPDFDLRLKLCVDGRKAHADPGAYTPSQYAQALEQAREGSG